MSWPMVKLGDVINVHYGKALKADQRVSDGSVHVFGSSGIIGNHDKTLCNYPTIIVGRKGSVGAITWAPNGGWIIDTAYYVEIKDNKKLDLRYLFHTLSVIDLAKKTITTSIPGLNRDDLYDTYIRLPPFEEQIRIADLLNKADDIRQKREQAIKVANDYLYSVFLDMFGDPVMNPKGFEIRVLSDFFIDEKNGTKCGPFGSALKKDEYTSEGVPVWNMDNITLKGDFIDLPSLWVSENKYQALKSYSVLDGDVIISRAGTVGKMGVVRSITEKSIISTNLIRVRFGEKLYPEYFVSLMTYCKGRVGNLKTGPDGTFTHMNTGVLSNLEFPYPPLELQKKYIKIRQSVMLIIDKYHHFGFRIDETFCAINQTAFLCQP
ncbi:restriction endonuclease subunit S [Pseudescherichia sp.]|uniref:restriction endonuclease subunit S n=1 Tax=Pseudescherichia sp. TaxID=2055881 RepID=UPI0039174743